MIENAKCPQNLNVAITERVGYFANTLFPTGNKNQDKVPNLSESSRPVTLAPFKSGLTLNNVLLDKYIKPLLASTKHLLPLSPASKLTALI